MENIIDKIDRDILKKELANGKFVRKTNNGNNEIYIITHHNSPNVMMEIGRLREVTFRAAGGGTGKSLDLDEFDTSEDFYDQLLVWNPDDEEIVGAYRYILCKKAIHDGKLHLSTSELFNYSDEFIKNYAPYNIELGRSFVQPAYQPSEHFRKGLFSLDNLWDGLGALTERNPDVKYFSGKVTMYTHFNEHARDMILAFMHHYFPDKKKLVTPIHPLTIKTDVSEFLKSLEGLSYKDGHSILNRNVRALGENIPPMVNAYMNLAPTMITWGTAINPLFGGVEETGIMIPIADIYESKKERHMEGYKAKKANKQ
ncbi:MAG: GNAT family N-acetyltransferase [Bacteroidia bacterium]